MPTLNMFVLIYLGTWFSKYLLKTYIVHSQMLSIAVVFLWEQVGISYNKLKCRRQVNFLYYRDIEDRSNFENFSPLLPWVFSPYHPERQGVCSPSSLPGRIMTQSKLSHSKPSWILFPALVLTILFLTPCCLGEDGLLQARDFQRPYLNNLYTGRAFVGWMDGWKEGGLM